ncbi:aminotransferase class I/II-fold pyridoxal phosphate-dependent enzyme [Achromobacter ruhlandii]|uniref:GDP-perosamine synthase n=1 Tax=Achromobacter ruhlandii TaxID=72557 RepID=A0A2M9GU44_9BURK|nr:aminotransferase class I/II-fold pyridoxal phosphate-dependent enzyme [Achromobacter ruhlandii]PJM68062.1 aminotransferase [Achromobacter ruhlandii]CAB3854594.1 UDP-4-amino-4-deoxy-L-arabinose--oxoglutarate aminotransferase [Achromobacter ruhlandii]
MKPTEKKSPITELCVTRGVTLREALERLNQSNHAHGMLLLVSPDGQLERTVTDGDLRRLILNGATLEKTLETLDRTTPIVLTEGYTRHTALELMNQHDINHLPVTDAQGRPIKVVTRADLDAQVFLSSPHLGELEREYVEEAFRTNWIAPLGPNVDNFEKELAAYVGIGHAAALSSGTAAIHLALRILGVTTGDTVFCSSLTFSASANPIVYQGAQPVFIDAEPESWNMSPQALARAFEDAKRKGKLPKAVIVVNLYGQSADMDPILALCDHYGVPLVEDAAESLGARYKGRASGTLGAIGIYSFNGNKIITTSGGGMLVSNDKAIVDRARFLSTQARDPAPHYQHSEIGFNYRMSNILAGVGRGQLKVLEDRVQSRRHVYAQYLDRFQRVPGVHMMPEPDWSFSTHWLSALTLDPKIGVTPTDLIQALGAEHIEARPVWKPMHLQPVFASCEYFKHGEESVSDGLFHNGICLPSGSNMSEGQLERTIACIETALKKRK